MLKGQSEIRMIWLMLLIIAAVGAWFLDVHALTYICGLALIMSVMQFVDAIEKPVDALADQTHLPVQTTSRVPLYLSSIVIVTGGLMNWGWMTGLGITVWIYFLLRWLRRLETYLNQIQFQLQQTPFTAAPEVRSMDVSGHRPVAASTTQESGLTDQLRQWFLLGNPVLKVAILILVMGIILLLRFATEHWQFSLGLKLAIVAGISCMVTGLGYWTEVRNRSFGLALEGLGQAGLFLTLFFAYYNQVLGSFFAVSLYFAGIMLVTLILSLRQQSIELALMALMIAGLAPFTLPVRNATAVELIAYYLVINLAIVVLSTLRPWKILNQMSFLMTVLVGGSYAFLYGDVQQRSALSGLVLAHAAVFIWLSFRFSQLIARQDIERFRLKPALDIALIFGAPIIAYIFLYLMYFQEATIQAAFSAGFALLYAGLYQLAKKNQSIQLISQSYFSLMLIFLTLIPPILLPEPWSVAGWAVEGLIIFIYALHKNAVISRYLAMGLLVLAGLSALYDLVEQQAFPDSIHWILSLSYFAVVIIANSLERFRQQLSTATVVFFSMLTLSATSMLLALLMDQFTGPGQYVMSLLLVSLFHFIINELLLFRQAGWSWLAPKWLGLVPVFIFALVLLIDRSEQGMLIWHSAFERWGFAVAGGLLTVVWLRPVSAVHSEKEWVSAGVFASLSMMSLSLIPAMPYISIVILPLLFCAWCYWRRADDWQMFWQSKSSLVFMIIWMICSQLFSRQAFVGYWFPLLNAFDLVSLLMLAGFMWALSVQLKNGMERGIVAVMVVLSLLWLSSYVVLRALHVYLGTPYNALALWQSATVQLSLTLLWVSLALVTMRLASQKQLRSMWILGGSILVLVTLKLILLDLSHIGTLTRVISFLGAGFVMLIIAYIAPVPEKL
ncbi:DUF2339 domain-containing protein [Acinetobacter sp. WZC-1]|uniref:DUF2339 domain-containing protein n=1 Tax=Acinetobacter sp. WZC-1 TaxID=3459034 RepID=UPI00403D6499